MKKVTVLFLCLFSWFVVADNLDDMIKHSKNKILVMKGDILSATTWYRNSGQDYFNENAELNELFGDCFESEQSDIECVREIQGDSNHRQLSNTLLKNYNRDFR